MAMHLITLRAYLIRTLIKNTGAIIFGVIVGSCITLTIVPNQSVNYVEKTESMFRDEAHSVDVTVANKLRQEVRVLCFIVTTSAYHETKAQHVKDTWGRRCNKLLFMSNVTDNVLGSIGLNITAEDNHTNLWEKTKLSFEYIHKHYMNDYDWFLKADDDTYVIIENLRYLLHRYSPEHPVYFGFPFRSIKRFGIIGQIYMSGGAGYVISREVLRRLVERGFTDESVCGKEVVAPEDFRIGVCMTSVNVSAIDVRDSAGRGTFLPFEPHIFLRHTYVLDLEWYKETRVYDLSGPNSLSDHVISFHYVKPDDMHVLDYFIYAFHLYGVTKYSQTLQGKLTEQEMQKII